MGVSISGLVSNMDTDAIVAALVSGYTVKKDSYVKKQTKLEWKQDAWKELNNKINSFYKNQLSAMRFSTAFNKKTSAVSGSQATVTASNNAVNGTQKLKIRQLATSGYLTGGIVKKQDGSSSKVMGDTKMSELGITDDSKINVKVGDKEKTITLNGDTTVNSLVAQLKDAGVNASFDERNQRFFISAKNSGAEGDFQLLAGNEGGTAALKNLNLASTTEQDIAYYREISSWDIEDKVNAAYAKQETALYSITGGDTGVATVKKLVDGLKAENKAALSEIDSLMDKDAEKKYSELTTEEKAAFKEALGASIVELKEKQELGTELSEDETKKLASMEKQMTLIEQTEKNNTIMAAVPEDNVIPEGTSAADNAFVAYVDGLNQKIQKSNTELKERLTIEYTNRVNEAADYVKAYEIAEGTTSPDADMSLEQANELLGRGSASKTGPTRIIGQDAEIELNGATFTSNTNTFQINGLTITANAETVKRDADGKIIDDDETVTITTDTDTQGVYDMIKGFFKEYNTLINEMDKLYNAPSSKGYEPLTDEEKEAMSEDEVEKWEKKIKDSLLRRDSTLDGVANAMKTALQSTFEINGKNYTLSSFGIKTLGYFSSADNEKSAYHIDGDKDDSNTSGNTDKLMAAIGSDPETVTEFFNKLTGKVYDVLSSKMRTSSLKSSFTVYNDKQMKKEYNEYSDLIEKWEDKIESYEARYRKQFAAMESALAALNSQQSQLSGLFS